MRTKLDSSTPHLGDETKNRLSIDLMARGAVLSLCKVKERRPKQKMHSTKVSKDGGGLLWIAFVLAMILMFLASCRSKQVVISEQVDSVCVSNTLLAEIRSQMLDFSFDSMEIVADTVGGGKLLDISYKLKIKGGRVRTESNELRAESCEKKDSVRVESKMEKKTFAPQKGMSRWWFLLIAIGFILAMAIVIKCRKIVK